MFEETPMNTTPVLLAFAWGHRNGEPGISNEDLGAYAVAHWDEYPYHSLQSEIARAVREWGKIAEYEITGLALKQVHSRDSVLIVRGHLNGLVSAGYDLARLEYHILCKEEHGLACMWFLQKELHARGIHRSLIVRMPAVVRFDPRSSQWYTRTPVKVWIYKVCRGIESVLRGHIHIGDVLQLIRRK